MAVKLILAAGLTDIISRRPTSPGKMKKTNHYVQWQQLKQLHKATYVGSYKPLASRVGLCVSAELWTFLSEPSLAEPLAASLELSRPKPPQTDERAWHNGLHHNKTPAYATVPLLEVECVFMYIYYIWICVWCVCVFRVVFVSVFLPHGSISVAC